MKKRKTLYEELLIHELVYGAMLTIKTFEFVTNSGYATLTINNSLFSEYSALKRAATKVQEALWDFHKEADKISAE